MREDLHYPPGGNECFTLELAGKSWCDGSYRIERQHTRTWVIEQILSGRGTVIVDGVRLEAKAGDAYLIPAESSHCYYADPKDPWVKIFMNVRGQLPDTLFAAYGLTGQVVFEQSGAGPLFERFYKDLCLYGSSPQFAEEAAVTLHRICIALRRRIEQPLPPEAVRMREHLEQNLHRLVPVAELAGLIYRSSDYASRLFRNTYGATPYAYLLRRKMELACRLLESSALPVKEIAARLGYEDAQYFSGLFRRMMGIPPLRWRKGERPQPPCPDTRSKAAEQDR